MSENGRQSDICIVINDDKSQDSTAKHLSCDWLLHYTSRSLIVKDFLESVNIWGGYEQEFSVLFFD